jgi:hypothetical protein
VHHSTIHKENPTRCNNVSKFLFFRIYMKLNMFRATQRPSSGAKNCTGNLWFFIREGLLDMQLVDVVRHSVQLVGIVRHSVPNNVHQLHAQQPLTYKKPETANAVLGS